MENTLQHIVIGLGEVGAAINTALSLSGATVKSRDIETPEWTHNNGGVMHVCIPWSNTFPDIVNNYSQKYKPDIIVVHSTVPVGTCDTHNWIHSPVRGRHPNLVDGVLSFPKHFGGGQKHQRQHIANSWSELFHESPLPVTHETAKETEAGKLWELVQYGIQIRVEKEIYQWCHNNNINYDTVYASFAETYNHGWRNLGQDHFIRPELSHEDGDIGGHCVKQMSVLLDHVIAQIVVTGEWTGH
nr:UDP-glucose/GDP-mannose dehydrogenase family, NAD binding domain protein [uncultured bacterium]